MEKGENVLHLLKPRGASVACRLPVLDHLPGILTTSEFEAVFQREAARADRFEREFSVVRIAFGGLSGRRRRRLARLLRSATRLSDSIGLLSLSEIGIILAEADAGGAEGFCFKLQGLLAEHGLVVDLCIFEHRTSTSDPGLLALPTLPAAASIRGALAQA